MKLKASSPTWPGGTANVPSLQIANFEEQITSVLGVILTYWDNGTLKLRTVCYLEIGIFVWVLGILLHAHHWSQDVIWICHSVIKNHHWICRVREAMDVVGCRVLVHFNKCWPWFLTSPKKAGLQPLENWWWTSHVIIRMEGVSDRRFRIKEDFCIFTILRK